MSLGRAEDKVPIVLIPKTPNEGQNVTFSVQNVTGTIRQIDWYRGEEPNGGTRIFTYFPAIDRPQRNGVQFTAREFGFPNGSLLISEVKPSDAHHYTVIILLRSRRNLRGTTDLQLAGNFPPFCFSLLGSPSLLSLLSCFCAPSRYAVDS